jgi:hypothetical protein
MMALSTYPALLATTKSWLGRGLGLGLGLGGLLGLLCGRRSSLLRFSLLGLLGLLRSRRGLLLGLLGLLSTLVLLSALGSAAQLKLDQILSNSDRVLLIHKEFFDGTRLGGIDGDVNLAKHLCQRQINWRMMFF